MLTPNQIKRRAENKYQDFLRSLCAAESSFFPLNVFGSGLGKIEDYVGTSDQIAELKLSSKENLGFGYLIEWEDRSFRRYGKQTVPNAVFFPTQGDFVKFLGKEEEVRDFLLNHAFLIEMFPDMGTAWAHSSPTRLVRSVSDWKGVLEVCRYIRTHGRPNCYIRELPVAVDTKFIERNKAVISDLLEVLAPEYVNTIADSFEERVGFKRKEPLVRVRVLDDAVESLFPVEQFALPISFLDTAISGAANVLIVENEMTFLTLPRLSCTVALLGSGDAVANIGRARTIGNQNIFYWGDLDVHGFEALSSIRIWYPKTQSVMMDCNTIRTFRHFSLPGAPTKTHDCDRLTSSEYEGYSMVKSEGIMLEQERIPIAFAIENLRSSIEREANSSHQS